MQPLTNLFVHLGWDITWWTLLLASAELLALLTVPSVLIQRRGQPLSALSWTLGLIAIPFAGVVLWWGLGRTHLERKRRKRAKARWRISHGFASRRPEGLGEDASLEGPFALVKRLPEQLAAGVYPPVNGNRVALHKDGSSTYAALEGLIRSAEHHVHLLFYIWQADGAGRRFRDLLCEKAASGVQVRVLLDAWGSGKAVGAFMDPLRRAGGTVASFNPTRFLRRSLSINFRNHRKIVVGDGRVAYTGGLNVGDEYTRDWRDMGFLLEGPVAAELQEVFLEDWYFATGEDLAAPDFLPWQATDEGRLPAGTPEATCAVVASGPDAAYNVAQDMLFLAFTHAEERIWITTPYLIPDPATLAALRTAVYRGVDVRLLIPRRSDVAVATLAGRSFYPTLLSSGIRVFEYLPATLHGKTWVFDREFCLVGTCNMDTRSFKLNFEVSCAMRGRAVNESLAALFEEDLTRSEEVTAEAVERTGPYQQLKEAAMNLLSPLL